MIIAIDFDGTLCEHKFPEIGMSYDDVIDTVKRLKKEGHQIILWTCRHGKYLEEALNWCKFAGLEFDAVNDDIEEVKNSDFGKSKSNKPFAHFYVDDKALTGTGLVGVMKALGGGKHG